MKRVVTLKLAALAGLLVFAGCGDQKKDDAPSATSTTTTPEMTSGVVEAVAEDDGSTETVVPDYSTSGAAVAEVLAKFDVGLDGVKESAKAMNEKIRPLLENTTERLAPEAVDDLSTVTRQLMIQLQDSPSIENEVRFKLFNMASGINTSLKEMRDLERGDRYEEVRKSVLDGLDKLNAALAE